MVDNYIYNGYHVYNSNHNYCIKNLENRIYVYMKEKNTTILIRKVPEQVREQFNALCSLLEKSANNYLIELISMEVNKNKKEIDEYMNLTKKLRNKIKDNE